MKKPIKIALLTFPFAAILVVVIAFGIKILTTDSPEESMTSARNGIAKAIQCSAHILEPKLYQQAEDLYQQARLAWKKENYKPIYRRNFDHVISLANRSAKISDNACVKSKKKAIDAKSNVQQLNTFLKKKREKFYPATLKFPFSKDKIKDFHTADLLMREASNLIKENNYIGAKVKLEKASVLLSNSIAFSHAMLKDYFTNFSQWQDDFQDGINYSKQHGRSVIIVDKIAHECYLYQGGKLKKTYEADFGKNWIGNKVREGDYATPEGRYKIVDKKSGRRTTYYKALLLDYPNSEDYHRINRLFKGRKHRLGGLIEIHGEGGKGADWTKGCVALSNSDMDNLFKQVEVGTRVIIVGSATPFKEIEAKYFEGF